MTEHTDEAEQEESASGDAGTTDDHTDRTASGDAGSRDDTADSERRVRDLERRNDELATELTEAEAEVERLRDRLDEKEAAVTRFKRQQREQLAEQKETATADLVSRLVEDVWDPLERAVAEDESLDVRDGVRLTLEELDAVLSEEGVTVVRPEPGDRLDRERHSVLRTVESAEPAGTILSVERPGFSMHGEIQEKARVCVAAE
jgi:molecular chaperone GrpE